MCMRCENLIEGIALHHNDKLNWMIVGELWWVVYMLMVMFNVETKKNKNKRKTRYGMNK